jgi:hypothetical protein
MFAKSLITSFQYKIESVYFFYTNPVFDFLVSNCFFLSDYSTMLAEASRGDDQLSDARHFHVFYKEVCNLY